jgi:hypothetical protein
LNQLSWLPDLIPQVEATFSAFQSANGTVQHPCYTTDNELELDMFIFAFVECICGYATRSNDTNLQQLPAQESEPGTRIAWDSLVFSNSWNVVD